MKKRFAIPFFMMMFLSVGTMQVHAETLKTESVTLTEEERYQEEYYGEPTLRYAVGKGTRSLARTGQTLEEYIVAALENFESKIDVSAYNLPVDQVREFFKVLNNNPQLFYVSNQIGYSHDGNKILSYNVKYLYSQEEARQMKEELEAAVDEAASQVDRSLEDYQQALIVHDYLVQNCEYDKERLDANNVPDISHTAYGSLVNKIAVCDGYADAFAYIMEDRLGITCEVISSEAMAHAWNMIEIGGKWYHVDATWDDPTWDCIGRVMHNYFLLSDSKISDQDHNHSSWSEGHTADSALYDEAFWSGVSSAICYVNDSWYYSKYQPDDDDLQKERAVKLVKKEETQLLTDSEDVVYATSVWSVGNSLYSRSFMYLAKLGDKIYFNTPTEIFRMNADGSVAKFYGPQDLAGDLIDGFTVRGDEFYYSSKSDFMTSGKQTNIRKIIVPKLEGISAEDVTGTYNGQPYLIEVTGVQDGDVVKYAGADGKYQAAQPQMVDAGTYEVRYQVERAGYMSFQGKATVTIEQAAPTYELPEGLTGYSGNTLADVGLPTGFSWQETDTQLREEGSHSYPATYTPEDSKNYHTVNVSIAVTVTCPGHRYISEVTKEPTGTEKGIMTYTCMLCENSYTEEIDELPPEITGITAEDVIGTYNGQSYTVAINGLEDGDIVQYALKSDGDAVFGQEQPEMINAGTYEVLYKVSRTGHQTFEGSVRVEIARAIPQYSVPTGLKGNSGTTLAAIELPEGFLWQTDAGTKLSKIGNQKFYVCYRPEDQANYQMVTDIEVVVEVTCPSHQYQSAVTKAPTETQKGLKTFTCRLCGKTYTEEIPTLSPTRPGSVAGLKMAKRTTNSLSYSWQNVPGVNYRLMFYQGSKAVSTIYVTGNAYTYKNLKPATAYTLQVTPYRVVNNKNVYAAAADSLRTATSPAKAKLSKAKRSGSSKVKLTWKKVAGASGYEIFMKTGSGKYKKIKTIGKGKTVSFTKTKLSKKKSYSFKIRAYVTVDGKKIYGADSNVKKVK